jgi:hypothetical protein
MDTTSVVENLRLLESPWLVTKGNEGRPIPLTEAIYRWNPDFTTLEIVTPLSTTLPVVMVISPKAKGKNGKPIDGTVGGEPPEEGYHRLEEDGFSGPSTYISLPFFPEGNQALFTHPTFLTHNSRPTLACYPDEGAQSEPISTGTLVSHQGDVLCILKDRRIFPSHLPLRKTPIGINPHLPFTIQYSNGITTVKGIGKPGREGLLPAKPVTVLTVEDPNRLTFIGFTPPPILPGEGYLMKDNPDKLFPIEGVSGNTLLLKETLLLSQGESSQGSTIVTDLYGTFLYGEFTGDLFYLQNNPLIQGEILGNTASRIFLPFINLCLPSCSYGIALKISRHLKPDDTVWILTPYLRIAPQHPLTPGTWFLSIEGGGDQFYNRRTDGFRDGDEILSIPDDTQVFTVIVPEGR